MLDPAANPFQPGPGVIPPTLGGRDLELARYRAMLARLAAGQPVPPEFLEGPRGIGKTALMALMVAEARERGMATVQRGR